MLLHGTTDKDKKKLDDLGKQKKAQDLAAKTALDLAKKREARKKQPKGGAVATRVIKPKK